VKLYLHTWRYGIETTQVYHCDLATYDGDTGCLVITGTVWPEGGAFTRADVTVTTVSQGDEFSVTRCDPMCHPHDSDPQSIVLVLANN